MGSIAIVGVVLIHEVFLGGRAEEYEGSASSAEMPIEGLATQGASFEREMKMRKGNDAGLKEEGRVAVVILATSVKYQWPRSRRMSVVKDGSGLLGTLSAERRPRGEWQEQGHVNDGWIKS